LRVRILDRRGWRIEVRPESEEDLWVLRNTLRPGDLVTGRTLRDVAVKGSEEKRRKPVIVTLELKAAEFQPFTGRLRLYGVIVEGPEEYGLRGKHHAMTIEPGQVVVIERRGGWSGSSLRRLESSGPRGRAVLAAVDYEEYAIALLAVHGYRLVAEGYSNIPGKDDPTRDQAVRGYIEKIARLVVETASREGARVAVIAGPGPLKEDVAAKVKELAGSLSVYVDTVSMGGRAGIGEIVRRPVVREALKEYSIIRGEEVLEEIMRAAARSPDRVVFGAEKVLAASRLGAVEALIVVDELLYTIDDEVREAVDEALENTERTRGEIVIVPADSPIGDKLKPLGGVAALLRFPLPI